MSIHHARGPLVSNVASKEEAEEKLTSDPRFPKNAELEVWQEDDHWTASWHVAEDKATWEHTAEFPPSTDSEEESPSPKGEGGGAEDSAAPPSDDGGESDGGEGPPKKEHGDKDGGGEGKGGTEHKILTLLETLMSALGLSPAGGEGLPGEEMGGPGGPPGGPPPGPPGPGGPGGPGGPPHGAPHGGGPGGPDQTIQHQRALKPGEAPPGATPIGAPAFASTQEKAAAIREDHPWKGIAGKAASFNVEADLDDTTDLAQIDEELNKLAFETNGIFKLHQLGEANSNGKRVAQAVISAYSN